MDVNCLEIFRRQTLDFNSNWLRWIKSTYNSNTRGTWKPMCSRTFITRMRGISFENHQWILYFQLTQFPFPHLPAILKNSISLGSLSGLLKTKVYGWFFSFVMRSWSSPRMVFLVSFWWAELTHRWKIITSMISCPIPPRPNRAASELETNFWRQMARPFAGKRMHRR